MCVCSSRLGGCLRGSRLATSDLSGDEEELRPDHEDTANAWELSYSTCEEQGVRPSMEDVVVAMERLPVPALAGHDAPA